MGPPFIRYNVCMLTEEDESPPISEQPPPECEDQFDEDLMRDLERRRTPQSQ
jgi:hypothetical protein